MREKEGERSKNIRPSWREGNQRSFPEQKKLKGSSSAKSVGKKPERGLTIKKTWVLVRKAYQRRSRRIGKGEAKLAYVFSQWKEKLSYQSGRRNRSGRKKPVSYIP